jgi:UDP-N-acetyl-D-mannosaminuronic acid dehydrogenase
VGFQTLCVLGLGYIGLPTASTFASHGLRVTGVDINQRVIDILRNGEVHIQEPGLRALVQEGFASGRLQVADVPAPSDAFVIAVPTPIAEDKSADLSFVISAAESIAPHIREGNLVVLESTCPPRTTLDIVAPILAASGLIPGEDFHLVYSPERVLPGQILAELTRNARVIGGVNRASAEAGRELYRLFVEGEILLTDATTAEMVKLMENTFRDINIAAANEFSHLAQQFGVDVWKAIKIANLHPRVNILQPGPGVGGHCISVDPWFLVEAAPDISPLIQQARRVNDRQPEYVVDEIGIALGGIQGKRIAALGLSYKADVDDLRESPAIEIVRLLLDRGANVTTFEPNVIEAGVPGARASGTLAAAVENADAVVLLVDHKEFLGLDPLDLAGMMSGRFAYDTRGIWEQAAWEHAGYMLKTLGVGYDDESE